MSEIEDNLQNLRGGTLYFAFKAETKRGLIRTIEAFGAISAHPDATMWLFPSGDWLLQIVLIDDVAGYANDLLWEAWQSWFPLFDALQVSSEEVIILLVFVAPRTSAKTTARRVTATLLEAHAGVVCDGNHVWTSDEIRTNAIRNGLRFFERCDNAG
jgi:hypothetical protein